MISVVSLYATGNGKEMEKRREEAETKRRQEEFEKNKRDALNSMKGISEGLHGLKGTDSGGLRSDCFFNKLLHPFLLSLMLLDLLF